MSSGNAAPLAFFAGKYESPFVFEFSQIEKMTIAERLEAMERLWESLRLVGHEMVSPEWHRKILMDRKTRAKRGEAKFLSVPQLKARLQNPAE